LSDGEFNQIIGFEVGHSLYPSSAYISGSIKFNNRNEGYSDQMYYSIEGGYCGLKNLLLNVRVHALQSFHNGNNLIPRHSFLFANNQQFIAFKLGAFYNLFNGFGVSTSFESGIIAYNIQSAPVFAVGIFFKN